MYFYKKLIEFILLPLPEAMNASPSHTHIQNSHWWYLMIGGGGTRKFLEMVSRWEYGSESDENSDAVWLHHFTE